MRDLSPEAAAVLAGGLALVLHDLHPEGVPRTEEEMFALTGADRNEACEARDMLLAMLPSIAEEVVQQRREAVMGAMLGYVMRHPEAVRNTADGRTFSRGFQRMVLQLTSPGQPGEGMSVADLARATRVAPEVLEEWLRKGRPRRARG